MIKLVELGCFSKGDFETWTELSITDEQWDTIADDIEGRVSNYIDELLEQITQDIEEGQYDD